MIQDIAPHKLDNQFKNIGPSADSMVFNFKKGEPLVFKENGKLKLPTMEQLPGGFEGNNDKAVYVFSVDEKAIFMIMENDLEGDIPENMEYMFIRDLYTADEPWMALAAFTANHLNHWYKEHVYCGSCGAVTEFSDKERAKVCPECGNIRYPRINPVIMAGVTDGERLLVTRYADRPYRGLALNAGFVEIGENLEEALRREVMEEVGLEIGEIKYFGSQPWGLSDSVITGFFGYIKGSDEVKLDKNELAEAIWMTREELPPQDTSISITAEMIEAFRTGRV